MIGIIITGLSLIGIDKVLSGKLYLVDASKNVFPLKYYSLNSDNKFCPPEKKIFRANILYSARCIKNEQNQTLFYIGDSHTLAFLSGAELISKKFHTNLSFINEIQKNLILIITI